MHSNFILNNIHEKISQFWLAKSSAIFSKYSEKKEMQWKKMKYSEKKWNTVSKNEIQWEKKWNTVGKNEIQWEKLRNAVQISLTI